MKQPNIIQRMQAGFMLGNEYSRAYRQQQYLNKIDCGNLAQLVHAERIEIAEKIKGLGTAAMIASAFGSIGACLGRQPKV